MLESVVCLKCIDALNLSFSLNRMISRCCNVLMYFYLFLMNLLCWFWLNNGESQLIFKSGKVERHAGVSYPDSSTLPSIWHFKMLRKNESI